MVKALQGFMRAVLLHISYRAVVFIAAKYLKAKYLAIFIYFVLPLPASISAQTRNMLPPSILLMASSL